MMYHEAYFITTLSIPCLRMAALVTNDNETNTINSTDINTFQDYVKDYISQS